MIQDIYPRKLDNSFRNISAAGDDALLVFDREGRILAGIRDGQMRFPAVRDLEIPPEVRLFSLDETGYFLASDQGPVEKEGFSCYTLRELYDLAEGAEVYAAFTAWHLWKWYTDNRFCGKCGSRLIHHERERALVCPACGNVIYPRINPAVIVGVLNGDSILVTRYREGYAHNALVAGFTEIGETVEETVRREVMEETGLQVKNIRYYKSQPWGMAQDILMGFFCEAEGDTKIRMDRNELKYARWVRAEELILQPNSMSLTNEMMQLFKDGKIGPAKI